MKNPKYKTHLLFYIKKKKNYMMTNYERNFEHTIFITPVFLWLADIIIKDLSFVHLTQDKFVYLFFFYSLILLANINISIWLSKSFAF